MKIVTNTFVASLSLSVCAFILAFRQHYVMSAIFLVLFGIGLLLDALMKDHKENNELSSSN